MRNIVGYTDRRVCGRTWRLEDLRKLRDVARRIDVGLFAQSRAGLYLLGLYPSATDSPVAAARRRRFATAPALSVDEMMSFMRTGRDEDSLAGRFVRRVAKSERNPFAGRISLGRAANNDVTVVHPSVSKLHAHFLVPDEWLEEGPGTDGGRRTPLPGTLAALSRRSGRDHGLRLVDVGSSNGTWVDDARLTPEQPVVVDVGAELRFGDVVCTLLDAARLHVEIGAL